MQAPQVADVADVAVATPRSDRARGGLADHAARFGVIYALLAMIIFFSVVRTDAFVSWANVKTILQLASPMAVVAFGVTIPMAVGDFDLSIAGMMSFGSALGVVMMVDGSPVVVAIAVALLVSALAGAANGWATAYLGASSFVITLASGQMLLGGQYVLTDQTTVFQGIPPSFVAMSDGMRVVAFAVVVGVVLWVFLSRMEAGRIIYAIGINPTAASFAGLRVRWWRMMSFAIVAVCATLAGLLVASRASSEGLGLGNAYLLPAYAAVFLGSVVLQPGRFTIVGTAIGVIFLQVLQTGLAMLSLPGSTILIIQGGVLVAAIVVSRLGRKA